MTTVFKSPTAWQQYYRDNNLAAKTLGFVPTMGNLHGGHDSLLKRSLAENEMSVLSIYVNPTQFHDQADFDHYPRTIERDIKRAQKLGVDYVFVPQKKDLYPDDYSYRVSEQVLSQTLEGQHRPGHFEGMLTIVMKLLCLFKPTRSYFGEKDYQQLQLIRGLVSAYFLDTEIIACETVRDKQGLALSSRNARLNPKQYQQALLFPKLLQSDRSCAEIRLQLQQNGFKVDYVTDKNGRRFGAVHIGDVRLIDNTLCHCERSEAISH